MNDPQTFKAAPEVTITLDIASLLSASKLIGEDYDDNPIYSTPFVDQLIKATADKVAKEVVKAEFRKQVAEQVEQQVHDAIASALDQPIRKVSTWGEPTGDPISLRQMLAERAAEEVAKWMKGDRYDRGKFADFLSREVDASIRADLKGVVDKARTDIWERMEAAATKAITDAAAAAVKGL